MYYFRDIFFIIILFCYNLWFLISSQSKNATNSLKLVEVPPQKNHKRYCTTLTNPLELVHYTVNPIHRKYILLHNTTQKIFARCTLAFIHACFKCILLHSVHIAPCTSLPMFFFFASLTWHCLWYLTTILSQSLYHVTFSTFCSPSLSIPHILCPYLHVRSFISARTWRRMRYILVDTPNGGSTASCYCRDLCASWQENRFSRSCVHGSCGCMYTYTHSPPPGWISDSTIVKRCAYMI